MDRRALILAGLATVGSLAANSALAADPSDPSSLPTPEPKPNFKSPLTYTSDELVNTLSDFMGVTAESAGSIIERVFKEKGRPTGYIAGEEGSGAIGIGLRYGRGLLYMKGREPQPVAWQGPSIGWDMGGNASRVFTLAYDLQYPDMIYRRFPGVDGSAYFVGGMGVNYQRADDITLAPIRAGVGMRLGANVGYLSYSRKSKAWPF